MANIRVFNQAVATLQKSQRDLAATQMARQKNQREKELLDQQKKINEAKLKSAKLSNQMTEFEYETQKKMSDEFWSQREKVAKAKNTMIGATEQAAANTFKAAGAISKQLLQDPQIQQYTQMVSSGVPPEQAANELAGYEYRYSRPIEYKGGKFAPGKSKDQKVTNIDKTFGSLQQGGFFDDGIMTEFQSRDEAEAYAASNLGYNWDKKYPQAKNMIDQKFGADLDPQKIGQEFQKNNIKNVRQAQRYLIDQYKISPEQARQWIERNN